MARAKDKRRYEVLTWDTYKDRFTPQQGVRRGPYTLFGLRKALRKLQDMSYPCDYRSNGECGDPSVQVSRL